MFSIPPDRRTNPATVIYSGDIAPSNTPNNPRYHHNFFDIDFTGDFYKGEFFLDREKLFVRHGRGIM